MQISKCRLVLAVALFAIGCGAGSPAVHKPTVVEWRRLGSWSGHGPTLTEVFTSAYGAFRVHWETQKETKPGAGTLKVVFRSADSGRDIIDAVDMRGVGRGSADVSAEHPRWYYLAIESANLEWTVTVEEPITRVARDAPVSQ